MIGIFAGLDELPATTIERYTRIADTTGYTVMLSNGFDSPPVPAAWGGPVDTSDPLGEEYASHDGGSGLVGHDGRQAPSRTGTGRPHRSSTST